MSKYITGRIWSKLSHFHYFISDCLSVCLQVFSQKLALNHKHKSTTKTLQIEDGMSDNCQHKQTEKVLPDIIAQPTLMFSLHSFDLRAIQFCFVFCHDLLE